MAILNSKVELGLTWREAPQVEKFWMVYGIGCGRPTYRHETKESAHNEASRLALANPGTDYIVLKATKGYRADSPKLNQFDLVDRDPDFYESAF